MVLYPLIPLRPLLAEDRVLRLLPKLNNLVFLRERTEKVSTISVAYVIILCQVGGQSWGAS